MYARRMCTLVILFLIVALVVAGCGGGGSPAGEAPGTNGTGGPDSDASSEPAPMEELVIAQGSDTTTLHPDLFQSGDASNLYDAVFDTILTLDVDGSVLPHLAESWKYEGDVTIIMELRQEVTWHDGEPFTAHDVQFTWEHMNDPDHGSTNLPRFAPWLDDVVALDDYTVQFTTKEPHAPALYTLASYFWVSPRHILENGDEAAFAQKPTGTGPYKVIEWQKDNFLALERNESYWGGMPPFPRVRFVVIPDDATRAAALMAGDVHIARPLPVAMAEQVRSSEGVRTEQVPSSRVMFIALTHRGVRQDKSAPIEDKRVRQALNYAIDRHAIAESVARGYHEVVPGPWSAGHWAYPPNAWDLAYDYKPDKARELLAEAGYEDGFTLTLGSPAGRYLMDAEVTEAIVPYFEDIGIAVDFQALEWSSYWPMTDEGAFSAWYIGLGGGAGDPYGSMNLYMTSAGREKAFYGTDPRIDEIVWESATMVDVEERRRFHHEVVFPEVIDIAPWIFLWSLVDLYGVSDDLEWTPRADEWINIMQISIKGE